MEPHLSRPRSISKKILLQELLSQVHDKNIHKETDWGYIPMDTKTASLKSGNV